MVRNYINTIWDMEEYANKFYNPFFTERARIPEFAYGLDGEIRKDAPVISTTTGWWNYIYGKKAWLQILLEANAFSIMPRIPYTQSGWRVITTAAATSGAGVAEHGNIPATTMPTWLEVKTKPKTMAIAFDASEVATFLGTIDDAIGDPMVELRPHMSDTLIDLCDRALLGDVTTVAGNDLESLDRVCSSYAEVTNCADVNAGDSDIYALDRDAEASWADAYVNHGSDSDRDLQLSHLDSLIQNCGPYWSKGGQRVFLTGWDTYERIAQLIEQKQRIVQMQKLQLSVNGVKTVAGHETGFDVCSYRTIPVVKDLNVVQDTISRIYLLDLGHVGLKVAKPIQYFESGMRTGDPFALGKFGDEGMFRLMGELICHSFKAQGKVRDLK